MPNKTIYVKDEDLSIFEEAEKLGGDSLSAVIAQVVKRFVAAEKSKAQGFEEHTLEVGQYNPRGADDTRKVRFVGRLLAKQRVYTGQTDSRDDRGTNYAIYQTKAGKIVVHWKHWSSWDGEGSSSDYATLDALPGHDDVIYGRLSGSDDDEFAENYPERLPGGLLQDVAKAMGGELVEFID